MSWERGRSGNPGGRPRSATLAARAVADRSGGGAEIVEAMFRIARGEAEGYTERSRFAAWEWLADRLWGKPAQSLELTTDAPRVPPRIDGHLSDDEMREMIRCCDRVAELEAKSRMQPPPERIGLPERIPPEHGGGAVAADLTHDGAPRPLRPDPAKYLPPHRGAPTSRIELLPSVDSEAP